MLSPEFLNAMFASAPFAVITTDPKLVITSWNYAAERVFGASARDRLGTRFADVIPEDRRILAEKMMKRALERGRSSEFDVRLIMANGQARYLSMILGAVKGPGGQPQGLAAWVRDRTRRVETDRKFHKAERLRALVQLAGGVAHHFNNTLGGLLTAVDFALTSDSPGAIRKALIRASEAVQKANILTESLLAFSEMDRRGFDMANLADVVSDFVARRAGEVTRHGLQFKLSMPPDLPPYVVDSRRFGIVLANLVTNAIESVREKGLIEVVVKPEQENLVVSVIDNGEGIPESNMDKLFEPFFTTKGVLGGGHETNLGLGLSVVYGIVTEMGAQLAVSSKVGAGTRVDIRFPLRRGEHAELLPSGEPASLAGSSPDLALSSDGTESTTFVVPLSTGTTSTPTVRSADPHDQPKS